MEGNNPLKGKNCSQPFDRTKCIEWNNSKLKEKWGNCGVEMVSGLLQ